MNTLTNEMKHRRSLTWFSGDFVKPQRWVTSEIMKILNTPGNYTRNDCPEFTYTVTEMPETKKIIKTSSILRKSEKYKLYYQINMQLNVIMSNNLKQIWQLFEGLGVEGEREKKRCLTKQQHHNDRGNVTLGKTLTKKFDKEWKWVINH